MLRRAAIVVVVTVTLLGSSACSAILETAVTPTPTSMPRPTSTPTATATLEPTPTLAPTATPSPTDTPLPQEISVAGPSCERDHFKENRVITKEVAVRSNGLLTLTVGSSPSIPCGWQAPVIDDEAILRQVDHWSEWPAEGVTPMPGAPGAEIWVFQTLEEGTCTISLACSCLGEEGTNQEQAGTFVLNVSVGG